MLSERESLSVRLLRCYYSRLETLHSWLQSQNLNASQADDPVSYRLLLSKTLVASFAAPSNGSVVLSSVQEEAEQVDMLEVGRDVPRSASILIQVSQAGQTRSAQDLLCKPSKYLDSWI
jgi:hypothetical protein